MDSTWNGSISPSAAGLCSPLELYDAGQAFNAEMRDHGCCGPVPGYTPHPAYDRFLELYDELREAGLHPLGFLEDNYPGMDEYTPFRRNMEECSTCGCLEYICHVEDDEGNIRCSENFEDSSDDADENGGENSSAGDFDIYNDDDIEDDEVEFYGRDMDDEEAFEFVSALDTVDLASIAPDDMKCAVCWDDFDDVMDRGIDTTPVRTPCCRQIFMKDCLVEALVGDDVRCPMCRQDIVGMFED